MKKYIDIVKKRLNKFSVGQNVNYLYSKSQMVLYAGNYATEYKNTQVNPDFIYLDGLII